MAQPTRVRSTLRAQMGPFAIIPVWLLERCKDSRAIHLYAVLGKWANRDGRAYPKRDELLKLMGGSASSLARAVGALKEAGGLEVTLRHRASDGAVIGADYLLVQVDPSTLIAAADHTLTGEKMDPVSLNFTNEKEAPAVQILTDDKKEPDAAAAILSPAARLNVTGDNAIEEELDPLNQIQERSTPRARATPPRETTHGHHRHAFCPPEGKDGFCVPEFLHRELDTMLGSHAGDFDLLGWYIATDAKRRQNGEVVLDGLRWWREQLRSEIRRRHWSLDGELRMARQAQADRLRGAAPAPAEFSSRCPHEPRCARFSVCRDRLLAESRKTGTA